MAGGGAPVGDPAFLVGSRFYATRVSSLWTPEGEHRVGRPGDAPPGDAPSTPSKAAPRPASGTPGAGGGGHLAPGGTGADPDDLSPEEQAELAGRLDELRRQLLETPADVVVANHAYGLFELAAIHLSERPPRLDQARLAVDGMGLLVEGLAGRLGQAEASLRDALMQIRLAFVQIGGGEGGDGGGLDTGGGGGLDRGSGPT